ncbi:MAG: hypothetical protein A2Y62_12115 [Candidatus Fischerbacteria bacterium RBG_13_37_8]|uniref:Methyltransferase n=1 Tax=Candidatus Fischerbacteria bacterium RBG_13_37_8 TaxID=1817863 RepID=A0A1F5VDG9_9BACT|nr:MAG: hypothetical protein A2Y62_12115 [Candidatus Fischerbacteria bacterium RBG_13_37_8]
MRITDSQYGKHWNLWKCTYCSVVFANPLPDESLLVQTYAQMNDSAYAEEETGRKKNFTRLFTSIEQVTTSGGRLLDIGAASGLLVELARLRGWQAEGLEISSSLVEEAKQKHIQLHQASIEDFTADMPFRVITAIDIIEHLHKPEILLKKAWGWLQQDGVLCLVTPDIGSITARLSRGKWWHFRPAHLYYFNKKSISHLLSKNGFEVIMIKHYVWHFSLSYLLSRFKWHPKLSLFKSIIIPLNLFDSMEIYARKSKA